MNSPHVIVIGAGFSGLVAARELQTAGISCEIVEARDRIGGRAWTDDRMGLPLEMGATWVHWFQPYIWSEVTRYNQGIHTSPADNQAYWVTQGEVHTAPEAEADEKMMPALDIIYKHSDEFFPNPHDPLAILREEFGADPAQVEEFKAFDHKSVMDILEEAGVEQELQDMVEGFWAAAYIGEPRAGSSLMAKQWAALSDHSHKLVDEINLRYKLDNGMRGIYEAIREDLRCPVHLETPVTKVEHGDSGVRVTLESGEVKEASAVICTVPLGALGNIEFDPALPEEQQRVIDARWNSEGAKIWIKIKGHHRIIGYAGSDKPMSLIRSEYFLEDDNGEKTTVLVGFGANHNNVDINDVADAQRIMDTWDLDVEAVDCTGHDWVKDKWTQQAWATLRKGQFIDGWSHFINSDSALHFAGADFAPGWRGVVVDGALQSGIMTARRVINRLRAAKALPKAA
ncbi:NAD(P)/FAD-dependent oxidoreductase [Corynebacterium sp.]|uniref:flavin monoamine oxidase family protein n=1 Tax=Corynebacterium sp. TaxID=1720 RepID=UPI0026DDAC91|nr:NAD(P)/FAD-dependent oxidoreductase [Corynebacterium sp.]MDO5032178.1 NAD(P)/FAD-dependent oxidoreductase [Corynebacterium sp.]